MPSKDESIHKQHAHVQKEHAEWLEKLHTWRAQHQRAIAKVARLQASLIEHDADLEEHLGHIQRHEQFIARHERTVTSDKQNGGSHIGEDTLDGHSDLNESHRELRAKLKRMERAHAETMQALSEALDELSWIHGAPMDTNGSHGHDSGPRGHENIDEDQVVNEASWESFPASDSPSFNPGRT